MSSPRRPIMANHIRCWIWGRNVVLEMLRAGRWLAIEVQLSNRCEPSAREEAVEIASRLGIETIFVTDRQLEQQCRSDEHQGLAARMPEFPYVDFETLLSGASKRPVVVMLDRIHDSFNFGAIVRSAEVLGIDGIIVGTHGQSQVNSSVVRSSAGAINYVPIAQVPNLSATVQDLRKRDFQIVGTSDGATETVFEPDYKRSTLILIGNEGHGIQDSLVSLCTRCVRIPVLGHVGSLNAAVSAGILFYEVLRQRRG